MNFPEVVVTGMGFVSSIGNNRRDVLDHLQRGKHGFTRVRWRPGLDLPITLAGQVPGYVFPSPDPNDWQFPEESTLHPGDDPALPPHGVYAVDAVEQALEQAHWSAETLTDPTTGLTTASGGSPFLLRHHLSTYESQGWRRGHPLGLVRSVAGTLHFNLASRYHIRGASCGFVSACTSGSHALGYAFDEILLGRQDRMLVVAAEECLVENVIPFDAMRAVTTGNDPDTACRPFDRQRDGFIVCGGAVALILENAAATSRPPLARMLGWGQASDGYHVAAPHPEGAGLARAMERALQHTHTAREDVDYVNAHATSTLAGDRAEALALRQVFPPAVSRPAVVSTKGLTGHGLSLSGVLEAALTVLSLQEGFVPANRNLVNPDDACQDLHLPTQLSSAPPALAMNNASGFGGAAVAHLFAAP